MPIPPIPAPTTTKGTAASLFKRSQPFESYARSALPRVPCPRGHPTSKQLSPFESDAFEHWAVGEHKEVTDGVGVVFRGLP